MNRFEKSYSLIASIAILSMVVSVLPAGFSDSSDAAASITVTDGYGTEFTFSDEPAHVITVGKGITSTVIQLGGIDKIVVAVKSAIPGGNAKKSASEQDSKREHGCHSHHHQMLLGCSNRWFAERYNVNNAWNFNGNNRNLNNNNVNNTNQVGAVANLLEKVITQI